MERTSLIVWIACGFGFCIALSFAVQGLSTQIRFLGGWRHYYRTAILRYQRSPQKLLTVDKAATLFYVGRPAVAGMAAAGPVLKLRLTGIGQVSGELKANIEDDKGGFYYVKTGDRVGPYKLVKLAKGSAVLSGPGGLVTLKIGQ